MRFLPLSTALLAVLAYPAWAAEWGVVPAFSVTETYSDNIGLEPEGFERTDWVTQLIPAISVAAVGNGLQFNLDYAPELTFYARQQNEDQIFHRLSALGTAELADELLFIDAGATVDQYNVSLQGPITDNNINTTGNRATVGTFYASPYLLHQFGSSALAQARFTYSVWNSDDQQSYNNNANTIDLDLSSGPAYRVLTGNLNYKKAALDYDVQPDLDAEIILATVRRLVTPTVGLLAQVGDEHYERVVDGEPTGEADGGSRWGVGLEWVPSTRTHLTAAVGKRFFGNAYLFELEHRTRLLKLRAGYTQDITTTRTEFFTSDANSTAGYLDPLYCADSTDQEACKQEAGSVISERGLPVDVRGPVNFFSAEPFLLERFEASVAMEGVRNIVIATVFADFREGLPGFIQTADSNGNQTGINLAWNLPIDARTFWNLYTTYARNKVPGGAREDDFTTFGMGFTRQFQPRLSGSLDYRGLQQDSTDRAFSYTENSVLATIRLGF